VFAAQKLKLFDLQAWTNWIRQV